MRTWQCHCGFENQIISKTCNKCRAEMPPSEVRKICTEVKAILRIEIQQLKSLCIEARLKKQEAILRKWQVLFIVLQVICISTAIGFLWHTGEYADFIEKIDTLVNITVGHRGKIDTLNEVATALEQAAVETIKNIQALRQSILLRLERIKHILKAVEETLQLRPRLHMQHLEQFDAIKVNLQRVECRLQVLKENVISHVKFIIGKYR